MIINPKLAVLMLSVALCAIVAISPAYAQTVNLQDIPSGHDVWCINGKCIIDPIKGFGLEQEQTYQNNQIIQ